MSKQPFLAMSRICYVSTDYILMGICEVQLVSQNVNQFMKLWKVPFRFKPPVKPCRELYSEIAGIT